MTSAITIPSNISVMVVTKDHDDFDAVGLTNTINIGDALPADCHPISVSVECTEAPGGGAISDYDIEIGDAADPNGFCTGEDHLAGGVGVYQTYGAYITTATGFSNASRQVQATATSIGANLDQATTGEWTFRIGYVRFGA